MTERPGWKHVWDPCFKRDPETGEGGELTDECSNNRLKYGIPEEDNPWFRNGKRIPLKSYKDLYPVLCETCPEPIFIGSNNNATGS